MLGVVGEQRLCQLEHPGDPKVGDPVVDRAAVAPRLDETA